jgi:hypothetical protein
VGPTLTRVSSVDRLALLSLKATSNRLEWFNVNCLGLLTYFPSGNARSNVIVDVDVDVVVDLDGDGDGDGDV